MPRETWLIFRHQLPFTLGSRTAMAFGMLQPVLYLALFGPLLRGYVGAASWRVFVPGVLMQLALFSSGMAGFGIVFDAQSGVLERLRVTPASRLALLLGRVLTNTAMLLAQSAVVIVLGFVLGLRAPVAGVAAGLGLLVPIAIGLSALSYAFALMLRRREMFAPLASTAIVPLLLLSGSLLPMAGAPGWLDVLSRATPLRYAVEGLRAAFDGRYTSTALIGGVGVSLAFAAVGLLVGTRTFRRVSA